MATLLKGYFTVPADVSDERVRDKAGGYIRKYVESFEKEGWILQSDVALGKPCALTEDIAQGRTRWGIMAYWDKAPVTQTFEVDENLIPQLLKTGRFQAA